MESEKKGEEEIALGSYTLVLKSKGGKLIWEGETITINTNFFPDPESAKMAGLREIGLRQGLQSVLRNGQDVLSDLKDNPELQQIFCWQGLRKIVQECEFEIPEVKTFPSDVMEFRNALNFYALKGTLPENLSPKISKIFTTLNNTFSKYKYDLTTFLQYLFSGNVQWNNKDTSLGRKNMYLKIIYPIEKELNKSATQKTESYTYQPPQSAHLSPEKLTEEAIKTKVGPKFLGGYYFRGRYFFNPTKNFGISQEPLQKGIWVLDPLQEDIILEKKRPYTGVFTPGQENSLPWPKGGFPIIGTLEPKNTFILMRDSQGGIYIEPKDAVNVDKPTPFSFDFILHECDDNRFLDPPTAQDIISEGGDLDPEMTKFIEDLKTKNHLSNVQKGWEIVNYIHKNFRYPNDESEIAQIDQAYQSQMQSNVKGLWQKMSEVGVMHCYWANILRNELCHRVNVPSAICEGPYVTKDPRWDFAVVEAPGLTEHAWGIVWDSVNEEWTHDGQDATPPKEKSDDEKENEDQDTEPQEGDFSPSDLSDQLSEEELEKLYKELENRTDKEDQESEPTPEERAAEQFEREKGVEKSTWDTFVQKVESWGRQLVSAQNSIDGKDSTLEQEDQKLTEMIKIRRQIPQTRFKGPVRQSEGIFLDEPVTAFVGSKSGDPDPVGWRNTQIHNKEEIEVTVFEQDFIADLSSSMDENKAVNPQHQMILQALYYDWRRNKHLSHSQNRENMTTPLKWKSQVYSFGGFMDKNLEVDDELDEKKLCQLDQDLQRADGDSSVGMLQALQDYKDSLTDADKKLIREGKKIKMLTITTDGDIPDQEKCKKLVQELRELGVVVQGIGFGAMSVNIYEVCKEKNDPTSCVILTDITQATQARSLKLKKVIQEHL